MLKKARSIYSRVTRYCVLRYGNVEKRFSYIYGRRFWGVEGSVSGPGSNYRETESIRNSLPELLRELETPVILDAPCGDYYWMKNTNLPIKEYIGVDIVKDLVDKNRKMYGADGVKFMAMNIIKDPLPVADIMLCRDCFIHFSFEHIMQALDNVRKSQIRYLLTTTFDNVEKNKDITTGMWRPIDLQKEPFLLPVPIKCLSENKEIEWEGGVVSKKLALWEVRNI